MYRRAFVLALVAVLGGAAVARAGSLRDLGSYEREALRQALDDRDLVIDDDPAGKVVGEIRVVNLEVFSRDEQLLSWLNLFHRTTREDVIAREVLVRPGEIWDPEAIAETRRKLRDPLYSSVAVVVPVRPGGQRAGPAGRGRGTVDVLVVTRDVWSLRMNTAFEYQEGELSELRVSLSENNLLGWRKTVSLVFNMGLGAYSIGPLYIDKNIGGTRMQLVGTASALFSRETDEIEGSRSDIALSYPLWSLDRSWGASVTFHHFDSVVRSFQGNALRTYDAPDTAGDDALPWTYDQRDLEIETEVVRGFGTGIEHRVGVGHALDVSRPSVRDSFPGDEVQRGAFVRDVLPRSELASAAFVRYRLFESRYRTYRDLDTFDLSEDTRLGPDFQLRLALASSALGSDATFVRAEGLASWTLALAGDGLARASVDGVARLEDGDLIDNELGATAAVASPQIADALRLVWRGDLRARVDEVSNRFYTLGGLAGLRGYPIGFYTGQRKAVSNLELRTDGIPIWVLRVGGLAFWDAGHAADRFNDLSLRHDLGLGIRWLIPQLSSLVFRLDWAIPTAGPAPGLPGRITAGFDQVF